SGSPSPMAPGWRWLEPCWSPSASSLRTLDRLLQFLTFAVVESLVRAAINIACSASSGLRLMHPFNQLGVTVTALFFLGGASKTGILRLILCHTVFACQDDHLEPAAWWEPAGKVPYRSHSPLRRETPALIGP
ncbi:MAG: 5'-nucleotidase, partial [Cyanobium sp.]